MSAKSSRKHLSEFENPLITELDKPATYPRPREDRLDTGESGTGIMSDPTQVGQASRLSGTQQIPFHLTFKSGTIFFGWIN
jgi:hypothetical protein